MSIQEFCHSNLAIQRLARACQAGRAAEECTMHLHVMLAFLLLVLVWMTWRSGWLTCRSRFNANLWCQSRMGHTDEQKTFTGAIPVLWRKPWQGRPLLHTSSLCPSWNDLT